VFDRTPAATETLHWGRGQLPVKVSVTWAEAMVAASIAGVCVGGDAPAASKQRPIEVVHRDAVRVRGACRRARACVSGRSGTVEAATAAGRHLTLGEADHVGGDAGERPVIEGCILIDHREGDLCVPSGAAVQLSAGAMLAPLQVYLGSIGAASRHGAVMLSGSTDVVVLVAVVVVELSDVVLEDPSV